MTSKRLRRTSHLLPGGSTIRTGNPSYGEAVQDMDGYNRPLNEVHGSGLHGWGVAEGLEVKATLNQPGLSIQPGIALDAGGRHISLAEGGNGEVATQTDANGMPNPSIPRPVTVGGVELPTSGISGEKYVTIEWLELFDEDAYYDSYGEIHRFNHTPWLRLKDVSGFVDDGQQIVLVRVTISAGNITALSHDIRRYLALPVETISLRTQETISGSDPQTGLNTKETREKEAARIHPRADGGLEVLVPGSSDEVHFSAEGGNFAKMAIQANDVVARRSDGRETFHLDSRNAGLSLGANGHDGNLRIKDSADREAISINGDGAYIVVGTNGNEGDIYVKDNAGQYTFKVDGNTGTVNLKRIDPYGDEVHMDARYLRVHGWDLTLDGRSGNNNRALVDANDKLVINYGNDYSQGIETPGNLTVRGAFNAARHVKHYGNWFSISNATYPYFHYMSINHASRSDYNVFFWYSPTVVSGGSTFTVQDVVQQDSRTDFQLMVAQGSVKVWVHVLCVRK